MMTADFTVGSHATGYPANVAAQRYGNHMPSVKAMTDTDNGNFVKAGEWLDWDYFEEEAVTKFEGKIIAKNPDGTFLVLVKDPGDALFVYTKPLAPYETPSILKQEKTFFNKAGDTMRTYVLTKFDKVAVSAEGFNGEPEVGAAISGVTNKKLDVASVSG